MISYQSPGVYVEEVASGPQPIAAAPTSVVAIVGTTQKGPLREPTRVTGWAGYHAAFGGPVAGSFTAEAMYGFFENGGPAAYVVRADPSVLATWSARQDDATEVFAVEARSPGGWANGVQVSVSPDLTAGSGQLYSARVTEAADVNLTAGSRTIAVASTAGITPGATLRLVTPTATKDVTVESLTDTSVTVTVAGAAFALPAGNAWVTALLPAGATSMPLAAGSGIRRGDLLVAVTPSLARTSAFVEAATAAAPGLTLTLGAATAAALAGGEFAPRVERLVGDIATAAQNVPLSAIVWRDTPAPVVANVAVGHEIVAANGLVGVWRAINRFEFPAEAPAGVVEAEVRLVAERYRDVITLVSPTLADLAQRYSFVPHATQIRLTRSGPAGTLDITRNTTIPAGWDAPATDPVAQTWDSVEFRAPADARDGLVLRCARAPRVGDFIDLGAAGEHALTSVDQPGLGVYVVGLTAAAAVNASAVAGPYALLAFQNTTVRPQRFALRVTEAGREVETFPRLALHPDHPSYYFRDELINDASAYIRVSERPPAAVTLASMPTFAAPVQAGSDRAATGSDLKACFAELERVTEPALVICPDTATLADPLAQADVIGGMIRHCEEFRRFAVVDPPAGLDSDQQLADWRLTSVSSIQAAVYAPYVRMINLDAAALQRVVDVPPSGFVAGVFARTDRERGVHKAPANERVMGIVGLDHDYTQRRQDLLNPSGVNLIRAFSGRGIRVWGARTASDDVSWRYVNVRRLFNLIETSVERSTQWVVFEPNTASTWLRIRVSVENFLEQLFRSGALAGASSAGAYRVRVGLGETMTETDIDLGLVVTEVAVAPAKPAEFVVFRFSHKRITE